jgi:membrane associated rhomboid family serine protease
MFLRQRLFNGHIRGVLFNTSFRCSPVLSILAVRFKSKKAKSMPLQIRANASNSIAFSTPLKQGRKNDNIQVAITPLGEFINELTDWRHSALLFAILVNSAALIVFTFWLREAHRSSSAKAADPLNDDIPPNEEIDGTIKDVRYVTPGQEWLMDNFTVTPYNIREGRYWTVFTSLFSHQSPQGLFLNGVCAHYLFTGLAQFGTVPVGAAFILGGVAGNIMSVIWMSKRGGDSYNERFPGQFFGGMGMTGGILSILGFAAAVDPTRVFRLWGVIPLRVSYLGMAAWLVEAFRYWQHTGWAKIQSSVLNLQEIANEG